MNRTGSSWPHSAAPCAVPSLPQQTAGVAVPAAQTLEEHQSEPREIETQISEGTTWVSDLLTRVRGKITRKNWRLVVVTESQNNLAWKGPQELT